MRLIRASAIALLAAAPLAAQENGARAGLESIIEADIRRRVSIIADDSMRGRDTPSKGLELTAAYIAAEFKRLGLRPGGDDGSFLQRYPINRRRLDREGSQITIKTAGNTTTVNFLRDARSIYGARPAEPVRGPLVLLAGALTADVIAPLALSGKVVLLVHDFTTARMPPVLGAVAQKQPAAIIIASNRDTTEFARALGPQMSEHSGIDMTSRRGPVAAEILDRAVAAPLKAAGIDVAQLRGSSTPVVRDVPALEIEATVRDRRRDETSAPNVVGIVEGSDPVLKNEYLVFSAHMDHVGVRSDATGGDSVYNGADDDASGTAAVVELAEAFSQPNARPKRSIIFLTVSGEEHGLWGSAWFTEYPPVPATSIVANVNIDMIGRNWKDTIVVIGKEHSDLGATLNRVNAAHPELGMRAIDDLWPDEHFYSRSDHFNFARRGIPVLFFFNGVHKDYHEVSDSPDKIDAEKEARIVRLIYLIGQDVANAADRPKWNPESYKKIVQGRR